MSNKKISIKIIFICFAFLFSAYSVSAIEQAPKISDREIVENLVKLKEGQKYILENIKELKENIKELKKSDKEIINKIDKTSNSLRNEIRNDIKQLLYIVLCGFFGLIGFILWDRHTMLAPLTKSNKKRRKKEKLIIKALKKYAHDDPKMASILKYYGLM